jgi:perosamine synthetase
MIKTKLDYKINNEIRTWHVNVPSRVLKDLKNTLNSKWINTGPKEKEFRNLLKKRFKAKHAVATNSGTSSLRCALASLNIGPGDEVISTPYTWLATNTAILEQGAKPVFVDINYDDLNISTEEIEKKITKKTKAIMCVHYAGNPVDLEKINKISKNYNIPVIEDCAHAMGSEYKNLPIGSGKNICCFSFQCVKIVTCGDGGAIMCNNSRIYNILQSKIWYGFNKEKKKINFLNPISENPLGLGFKMNMNDIVATFACVAMEGLDEALRKRKIIGDLYKKEFMNLKKIKLINYKKDRKPNYQIFPIYVKNRSEFAKFMWKNNVQVNINNRRNDVYTIFGGINKKLTNLNKVDREVILLPLHLGLKKKDIEKIIGLVLKYDQL